MLRDNTIDLNYIEEDKDAKHLKAISQSHSNIFIYNFVFF